MGNQNERTGDFRWKAITGLAGAIALMVGAYITYLGIKFQTLTPIQFTQTAEAKVAEQTQLAIIVIELELTNTALALTANPIASPTLSATPTETLPPTVPLTPSSIPTETLTPTSTHTSTHEPNITFGNWIVVVGKYGSLNEANRDIQKFIDAGYENTYPVMRFKNTGDEIRAAIFGYANESEAENTRRDILGMRNTAYLRKLSEWCISSFMFYDSYVECIDY